MKKDLLPDGGEDKRKPRCDLVIEHFDKPRDIKPTRGTTLEMLDGTPLANWFRENKIVGVL